MDRRIDDVLSVLSEVIVPLVEADGGEVFLVTSDSNTLVIHLAGRRSGAPGNAIVCRRIIEPAVHAIAPHVKVVLTAGRLVPTGAQKLTRGQSERTGDESA